MSNKASENYLDNLLDSITDMGPKKKKPEEEEKNQDVSLEEKTVSDDEFLRDFEAELESDSYKDYFAEFERELEDEQNSELEIPAEKPGVSDDLGSILKGIGDNSGGAEAIPDMPEPTVSTPEEMLAEMEDAEPATELPPEKISFTSEPAAEPELKMTDAGEPDLSGNSEDDLLAMLSKSGEFDDLGEMLSDDPNKVSLGGTDEFEQFAKAQMEQQETAAETAEPESEDTSDSKKKKKKTKKERTKKADRKNSGEEEKESFTEKLKKLLFGEEENDSALTGLTEGTLLSDENADILSAIEAEEKGKAAKDKKEKKTKEKKPKEPKPKKQPKPQKPPKPKKEKLPKKKDHTPPLPKGPVIMIVIMVVSMTVLVMLGTNLLSYSAAVASAKEAYSQNEYTTAYQALQGEKIAKKDEELYNKLSVLAAVSSEYDAYLTFADYGSVDMAFDSLVCAAGRYNLNLENAIQFECTDELDGLRQKISDALSATYGMDINEAIEMYNQRNRTEYTIILHRKLKALGLE
ncbi:MAG: hypothetical protein MR016_10565 [Agathobacter sp.]|nr:hypothetical protein [Agathobacter sp.]